MREERALRRWWFGGKICATYRIHFGRVLYLNLCSRLYRITRVRLRGHKNILQVYSGSFDGRCLTSSGPRPSQTSRSSAVTESMASPLFSHHHESYLRLIFKSETQVDSTRCYSLCERSSLDSGFNTDQEVQTDTRIGSIEVKIKKLDGELIRYKEQMAKLRNGPGKVTLAPIFPTPPFGLPSG